MAKEIINVFPEFCGKRYNANLSPYDCESICRFLNTEFLLGSSVIERVYLLLFNSKMQFTYLVEISRGTAFASCVNLRDIFRYALVTDSFYMVLVHNHPNGDVTPSSFDLDVVDSIQNIKSLGVILVSNIILTSSKYYETINKKGGDF